MEILQMMYNEIKKIIKYISRYIVYVNTTFVFLTRKIKLLTEIDEALRKFQYKFFYIKKKKREEEAISISKIYHFCYILM